MSIRKLDYSKVSLIRRLFDLTLVSFESFVVSLQMAMSLCLEKHKSIGAQRCKTLLCYLIVNQKIYMLHMELVTRNN